jgi:hypothetical protein
MVVNQFGANIRGRRAGLREVFIKPRLPLNNVSFLDGILFFDTKKARTEARAFLC